jgi:hypothetical protein
LEVIVVLAEQRTTATGDTVDIILTEVRTIKRTSATGDTVIGGTRAISKT